MKQLTIFLIVALFFGTLFTMEDASFYAEKRGDVLEQIVLFASKKDFSKILDLITTLRYYARRLDLPSKVELNNQLILLLIKKLKLFDKWAIEFMKEYWRLAGSRILSSNETTPRVEDNISSSSLRDNELGMVEISIDNKIEKEAEIAIDSKVEKEEESIFVYDNEMELLKFAQETEDFSNLEAFNPKKMKLFTPIKKKIEALKSELGEVLSNLKLKPNKFIDSYITYRNLIDLDDLNGTNKGLINYAIEKNSPKFLEMLLKDGADLEITTAANETPLFQAMRLNKVWAVKLLMEYNANPYMSNKGGIVELQNLSTDENKGSSILKSAAEIKNMLANYVSTLSDDQTFRFMAQADSLDLLKNFIKTITKRVLVEPKADDKDSEKPSDCQGDDKNLKEFDIDKIFNSFDERTGNTALHSAVKRRLTRMILYLIEIGCNPDIQNIEGNTPLHLSVLSGYLDGVYLLLFGKTYGNLPQFELRYKGANRDIENKLGYSSQKIVKLIDNKKMKDAFCAKGTGKNIEFVEPQEEKLEDKKNLDEEDRLLHRRSLSFGSLKAGSLRATIGKNSREKEKGK